VPATQHSEFSRHTTRRPEEVLRAKGSLWFKEKCSGGHVIPPWPVSGILRSTTAGLARWAQEPLVPDRQKLDHAKCVSKACGRVVSKDAGKGFGLISPHNLPFSGSRNSGLVEATRESPVRVQFPRGMTTPVRMSRSCDGPASKASALNPVLSQNRSPCFGPFSIPFGRRGPVATHLPNTFLPVSLWSRTSAWPRPAGRPGLRLIRAVTCLPPTPSLGAGLATGYQPSLLRA